MSEPTKDQAAIIARVLANEKPDGLTLSAWGFLYRDQSSWIRLHLPPDKLALYRKDDINVTKMTGVVLETEIKAAMSLSDGWWDEGTRSLEILREANWS